MDRQLAVRWARATWIGWVLGVPIIILLALLGEALGIGGNQVLVGLGAGAGVGFMQSRIVRSLLGRAVPWVLASTIGPALPFLAYDLSVLRGWQLPYSLPVAVAIGGLIAGVWQAWLLRTRVSGAILWIPASLIGWALAAALVFAADSWFNARQLRGLTGAFVYLGTIAAGGLLVGIVTGLCLGGLTRHAAEK